jgi:hypothetical protein
MPSLVTNLYCLQSSVKLQLYLTALMRQQIYLLTATTRTTQHRTARNRTLIRKQQ